MGVGSLFPFHHVVLGIEPGSSDLMAPNFIPAEAISQTLRDFRTFQEAEGEARGDTESYWTELSAQSGSFQQGMKMS